MTNKLKDKCALITGVSRQKGIGAALAKSFASNGANVFISYFSDYDKKMPWGYSADETNQILLELQSFGIKCDALEIDLSSSEAPEILFSKALASLGHIDILVNNACYDIGADILSVTPAIMDQHFKINVMAPLFLTSKFISSFKAGTGGRIINLTSGQATTPMPESIPYAITKAAIDALTFSLNNMIGKKGITINSIDPGPVDTGWMSDDLKNNLELNSPFGRVGLPTDVAALALFLASSEGQWVTGQVLKSRGGH